MSRYSNRLPNRYRSSSSIFDYCGCILGISIFSLNAVFGEMSVNYLLVTFLQKTIPFWWGVLTGLFVGELTIPVAVVVWILKHFGIL